MSSEQLFIGDLVNVKLAPDRWREGVVERICVPHDRPAYVEIRLKGTRTRVDRETSERGTSFLKIA